MAGKATGNRSRPRKEPFQGVDVPGPAGRFPAWVRGLAAVFLAASLARADPGARQRKLEQFRAVQAEIRAIKQRERQVRRFRLQAEADARERAFRAWRGRVEARKRPQGSGDQSVPGWPSRPGLLVLAAGAVVVLLEPGSPRAWAQAAEDAGRPLLPSTGSDPSSHALLAGGFALPSYPGIGPVLEFPDFSAAQDTFGLATTFCADPFMGLLDVQACAPEILAGVPARIADLEARTLQLFVPPERLGAGSCRPGESPAQAQQRIRLFQTGQSLQYDRYSADALALRDQFLAVGLWFRAVGLGLRSGQALALPLARNRTLAAAVPALVFAELDDGLSLAGFAIEAAGNGFGVLAADALVYQANYQLWAQGQTEAALACTGTATALPTTAPSPPLPSPLPVLADLLSWAQCCQPATAQYAVDPSYCGAPMVAQLQARNGTLAGLYLQSACPGPSESAGCPGLPQVDASGDGAILRLKRYAAELSAVRYLGQAISYGLFGAGEVLRIEGEPLQAVGNAQGAAALFAGRDLLFALGAAVKADSYYLDSIGAMARGQAAILGLEANAQRWAQLNQEETRDAAPDTVAAAGSAGASDASSTQAGQGEPAASAAPPATASTAGGPPASTAGSFPDPPPSGTTAGSAAGRARPLLPVVLVLALPRLR